MVERGVPVLWRIVRTASPIGGICIETEAHVALGETQPRQRGAARTGSAVGLLGVERNSIEAGVAGVCEQWREW